MSASEKLKGDSLTMKFVGYVSPYLVVTNGGHYTKHIYAGTQRIASKLGDINAFGADPRRVITAGHDVDNIEPIDFSTKYKNQNDAFKSRFDSLGAKFNGKSLDDYVNGKSFCCNEKNLDEIEKNGENKPENAKIEDNLYFYHPDHLGSTSMVTNYDGEVTQNVAYIPYGEIFVEERNGSWNTPYLFNAKELDEETGLYYYGARYLDPMDARWLSVDQKVWDYPGMSPYNYCAGNPVKLVDPDGEEIKVRVYNKQLGRNEFLTYSNSNFWHENGKRYNPQKENLGSNVYKLLSSYRKIENSNDETLKKQLNTLRKSKNVHWIDISEEQSSGVVPYTGNAKEALEKVKNGESVGSWTVLNFSEKSQNEFEKIEGIEDSYFSTVTHELSHQYDNEVGNNKEYINKQKGKYDKNPSQNPSEIRAVETENRGRRIENLKERKTYGGKKIDFNQNH